MNFKKFVLSGFLIFCGFFVFAATGVMLEDGSVEVTRNKGDFEDYIKIFNKTDSSVTISVSGIKKRGGAKVELDSVRVAPHSYETLETDFDEKMELLTKIIFSASEGAITDYSTDLEHNDLYFNVLGIGGAVAKKAGNSASSGAVADDAADQLLKYKKLLDSGVITQEEFNTLKKKLLGL